MKEKSVIDKTLHFLVHNSNMVTVAVMGFVHATLLLIMLLAGVMPLVQFNILSVIVYLFCSVLCKAGYVTPVYISILKEKMEYLRRDIQTNPTVFFNKRIAATVTIGLEENKESYHEPEEVIKKADGRMYYGKQHGKNIVIAEDEGLMDEQ